ncbi:hypothetical protein [Prosthecobacter sp.]|uniref:hypothetical protein n=1 Tax=Prosthecobacter sp. TaxID=1965333 RepID=UPI0037831722
MSHHPLSLLFCFLWAILVFPLHAGPPLTFETLTTTKGVTYHNVKISRYDALELRFTHATGATSVPLADLPADLQKLFGYDPLKASAAMAEKHEERVKTIIADADKKARAAAQAAQEEADIAELKNIRAGMLRCHVDRVTATEDALLIDVSPADKLPVKLRGKNGKYERVKLTPQGKPELVEQIVPGKDFAHGSTLRILPTSSVLLPNSFISVYLIGSDVGPHTLCALSPESALLYRKKLAALKAAEPPAK